MFYWLYIFKIFKYTVHTHKHTFLPRHSMHSCTDPGADNKQTEFRANAHRADPVQQMGIKCLTQGHIYNRQEARAELLSFT